MTWSQLGDRWMVWWIMYILKSAAVLKLETYNSNYWKILPQMEFFDSSLWAALWCDVSLDVHISESDIGIWIIYLSYQILHCCTASLLTSCPLCWSETHFPPVISILTLHWLPLQMSSFIPLSRPSFYHPEVKDIFSSSFSRVHVWTAAGEFTMFFICFPHRPCLFSLKARDYGLCVCFYLCVCVCAKK